MKTHVVSLLAGTALIATISVAEAGERMILSENQLDQVDAGIGVVTINGAQVFDAGNGVVTINGVPVTLPPGVFIEVIGNDLIFTFSSGVRATITDPTNVMLTVLAPAAR